MHLLVVDSEESLSRSLGSLPQAADWRLRRARNVSAMNELLTLYEFDFVMLEPSIPGGSWYRLLAMFRRLAPRTPFAVVTYSISGALIQHAAEAGAVAVLKKPQEATALLDLASGPVVAAPLSTTLPCDGTLAFMEWEWINNVIADCQGNLTAAARRLGIPRQSLYAKLRKESPVF